MRTVRLLVGGIICLLILWVTRQPPPEPFAVAANDDIAYTNKGDAPWQRHPINSTPADIVSTYSKAYYHELSNSEYDVAIKNTFKYSCSQAQRFSQSHEWQSIPLVDGDPSLLSEVRTVHTKTIAFIEQSLNDSQYMRLLGSSTKLQIVHDILLEAKRHVQRPSTYILTMEVIAYREAKYNGKHMRVSAVAEYNVSSRTWNISVIELDIIGVVFEDHIGLHPVVANYPMATSALPYDVLEKGDTTIIPDVKTTSTIVEKQNKLQRDNIATEAALSLS